MNKWEVDEHKQWSEKVRSHRFCPHMLDKNRNYESNKRKSPFVEPVGMNGPNFKNETLFLSFTAIITTTQMGEMAQTFISEMEWLTVLKCRATGLSTSLFLTELYNYEIYRLPVLRIQVFLAEKIKEKGLCKSERFCY